jgi:hypothetical protein
MSELSYLIMPTGTCHLYPDLILILDADDWNLLLDPTVTTSDLQIQALKINVPRSLLFVHWWLGQNGTNPEVQPFIGQMDAEPSSIPTYAHFLTQALRLIRTHETSSAILAEVRSLKGIIKPLLPHLGLYRGSFARKVESPRRVFDLLALGWLMPRLMAAQL